MADPKQPVLRDKSPRTRPAAAPRSVFSQGELRTLYKNRPAVQGAGRGYTRDVNLPVDTPKAIAAPRKMTR